jgi:hypothetical protein
MNTIPISKIRTDGGTQPRAELSADTIAEYRDAMAEGTTFPAVIVFHDGTTHWLADGFHRLDAAKAIGAKDIAAEVRQGTQRDAILFSVGANALHGLRRTNADKRRAVERLLADEEWSKWSDREIARRCGVSPTFVSGLRPSLSTVDGEPAARTYTTKHGTVAKMRTGAIAAAKTLPPKKTSFEREEDRFRPVKKREEPWTCALTISAPHDALPRLIAALRNLGLEGGGGSSRKMRLRRVDDLRDDNQGEPECGDCIFADLAGANEPPRAKVKPGSEDAA